jgi:hypothetical protein
MSGGLIIVTKMPVWMVHEGTFSKGLLDLFFRGISRDLQDFPWIVILVHFGWRTFSNSLDALGLGLGCPKPVVGDSDV